jgi:hypothetical protein
MHNPIPFPIWYRGRAIAFVSMPVDPLLSTASNWAQATIWVPDGYPLDWRDDFDSFDNDTWSTGLSNNQDAANHVIWNRQTGGPGLLNFQYAGFNLDANVVVENGALKLYNHREDYVGPAYEARNRNPNPDPAAVKTYQYTSGWVNSRSKKFVNGSNRGVYVELQAKFPSGKNVWPAI